MYNEFDWHIALPFIRASTLLIVGYVLANILSRISLKFCGKYATPQQCMILKKVIYFAVILLFLITALQQLGFKLSVLLGSAGIITAAVGFASQTSMSNLISGVFLILEKAFVVGDTIRFKTITGKIQSIDLLSVKVKTFDNTLVRIPNSSIISTELTNLTAYPKRRIDLVIGTSYDANIDTVKAQLIELAKSHDLSLKEPEPKVIITDFADSSVNLKLSVWAKKADYTDLKNDLQENIHKANIDIPYPQLTVHLVKDS